MVDIMSFDPGVTTGMAIYNNQLGKDEFGLTELIPGNYPHPHETLFDVISANKPKKIVYEAFHHRQQQSNVVFKGVEFIGVIELYAQLNCLEVVKITPSDGKGFWTDKKLKALGIYKPGLPHGNDAMRVLLRHLMKHDEFWFKSVLPILRDSIPISSY